MSLYYQSNSERQTTNGTGLYYLGERQTTDGTGTAASPASEWIPSDARRAARITAAVQEAARRAAAAWRLTVKVCSGPLTDRIMLAGGRVLAVESVWCDVPVRAVIESADPAKLVLGFAFDLIESVERKHGAGAMWIFHNHGIMHLVHDDRGYVVASSQGAIFRLRTFYAHDASVIRPPDGPRQSRSLADDLRAAWSHNEVVPCCWVNLEGERSCRVPARAGAAYCDRHRGRPDVTVTLNPPEPPRPVKPLRAELADIDGVPLGTLLQWDEDRRREGPLQRLPPRLPPFTPSQRAAVAAVWSAQLRARVEASQARDAERAVSIRCEIDDL